MNELHIVPDFRGTQKGTAENPFGASTSAEFDSVFKLYAGVDQLAVKLSGELFKTQTTKEFADDNDIQRNRGFRVGKNWTIDLSPETKIVWDVDAIPDDEIDDAPRWLFLSIELRNNLERLFSSDPEIAWNPQTAWDNLPEGQMIRGGLLDLQFDKARERWQKAGKKLRIGGAFLSGHSAGIEVTGVTNYGAWNYEAFPLMIAGTIGMYDRNLIAQTDPATHIYDEGLLPSHITGCQVKGFCEDSNNQVTARLIAGSFGERTPGEWVMHYRRTPFQVGNETEATGKNQVQGHTIYHGLGGIIARNKTKGVDILAYGDYFKNKGLQVIDNEAIDTNYIARYVLSPTGPDWKFEGLPEHFSHEDMLIARNKSETGIISIDTLASAYKGPPAPDRYIRGVAIIENETRAIEIGDGVEEVVRRGNHNHAGELLDVDVSKRGGCFGKFHR